MAPPGVEGQIPLDFLSKLRDQKPVFKTQYSSGDTFVSHCLYAVVCGEKDERLVCVGPVVTSPGVIPSLEIAAITTSNKL